MGRQARGLRGNLLNDGDTVYAYDQANCLIGTTLSGLTTQFGHDSRGVCTLAPHRLVRLVKYKLIGVT